MMVPVGTMTKGRINFDLKTRLAIAMRSGYRCAHPECTGRTTIGPGKRPHEYETTGKASHIFAASKRGPRGQGNLPPEELRSAVNGIWLCSEHADQVDSNNGKDYPPPVLLGWKAAHEFKIAREHGAMLHPFGWVETLQIIDTPVFRPDQRIVFANANVITGENGVGKTTICEWLLSLKNPSKLRRWGAYPSWSHRSHQTYHDVHIRIDLRAPDRQVVMLDIQGGRPTFVLGSRKLPFCPIGYEVAVVAQERRSFNPPKGDLAFIAKCLQMDEIGVQALADYITEHPGIFLKGVKWNEPEIDQNSADDERLWYLDCVLPNGDQRPLRLLSSSETGAVLADLAIARAKILAMSRPTMLIIEAGSFSMSGEFLSLFLNELSSPEIPFQSIVVTTELGDDAIWGGWQVIRLSRPRGGSFGEELTEIVVGDIHAVAN
jgi:hypothetical protein